MRHALTALLPPAAAPPAPPAAAAVTAAVAAAPPAASAAAGAPVTAAAAAAAVAWTPIETWGFQDNGGEDVEVTLLGLAGVGALPPDAVSVSFGESSLDVRISPLRGAHLRLRLTALEHDIQPAACRYTLGKSRIVLQLRKAQRYDVFHSLVAKKPRKDKSAAAAAAASDPSAGIMDMMRQMYEDGDEGTKKVIAEAWTKSRESKGKGGGGSFDAGAGDWPSGGDL